MTTDKTKLLDATYEVTIGKRSGETRTFKVNLAEFPVHAIERIIAYGVQRTFNDKVGGSDTTLEEKAETVRLLIERWKRGDIGREPKETADPVTMEARKLVGMRLRKTRPDLWKKVKDRDDKAAILDKIIEQNPDIKARAEELVLKRLQLPTFDLSNLDI